MILEKVSTNVVLTRFVDNFKEFVGNRLCYIA